MREDFPKEIVDRRRLLNPIVKKAKEEGMEAWLSVDRLILGGKSYTVDNLDTLPKPLQPEEVFTKRSDHHTAFFTKNSPLSNHYPSRFKIGGVEFLHEEQHYMYNKALHCKDQVTAKKILNTSDPGACKSLGRSLKIPDQKVWKEQCTGIMYEGLVAKFEQNPNLCDFLLSTGDTTIIECNKYDPFWAIGLSLNDKDIFDSTAWKGENRLGRILGDIRDELK